MKVSKEVVDQLAQVTTATLSTLMLKDHGLANTCIRNVRLVNEDGKGMAGPAYTMRYLPGREDLLPEQWLNHPNNLMRVSVESMSAGVIVVMDSSVHDDVGLLGGNLLARMICRGVGGVVADGGMRDRDEIRSMPIPVYCRSIVVPTSFPSLMLAGVQESVSCGGVTVFPDDIIVGDADGVVVVPAHLAESLAVAGLALDGIEQWVHLRLMAGAALDGLYPPDEQSTAQYHAWVKAGRPADRLIV
ncbi:MAG: ribonuclease activity regulator RraA [Burkholderiaceae bacterium]